MVVKNSLARGPPRARRWPRPWRRAEGTLRAVWGGEDIVSLAKEIAKLDADDDLPAVRARGGVMDGEQLSPSRSSRSASGPAARSS